jgi:orotate phosphoribosyltransferase
MNITLFDASGDYSTNLTDDLGKMAYQVNLSNGKTLYDIVWQPNLHGYETANDISSLLQEGYDILKSDKLRYKTFNPENGSGTFTGLCSFISDYRNACLQKPDATIYVTCGINYDALGFKEDRISQLIKDLHKNNVIRLTKTWNKFLQPTPYDFRIDRCCSSEHITNIGLMMADRVIEIEKDLNVKFDSMFCSLFSGVFVGVSTSMWLRKKYNRNINIAISRRSYFQNIGENARNETFLISVHELKNKTLVGELGESVLIFDEMVNTGNTVKELIEITKFNGIVPKAVMIIADRISDPVDNISHIRMYGDIPCYSSITHFEIVKWCEENQEIWNTLEVPSAENQNEFNADQFTDFKNSFV